jgi:hypothetical protein|uniref:Uncharacterized protein n=1 Tax=Myoviridae sp. ctYA416 TaxID=2825125 RepID=A0A8S5UTM0_9CAUD|nr:MAG TPA: hypothetical protein [Myoviridae sp. ctYA416]
MNELAKSLKESLPKAIISNEVKINRYEDVFYIDGILSDEDTEDGNRLYTQYTATIYPNGYYDLTSIDTYRIFPDGDMELVIHTYEDTSDRASDWVNRLTDKQFLDLSKLDESRTVVIIYDKDNDSIIYDRKTRTLI